MVVVKTSSPSAIKRERTDLELPQKSHPQRTVTPWPVWQLPRKSCILRESLYLNSVFALGPSSRAFVKNSQGQLLIMTSRLPSYWEWDRWGSVWIQREWSVEEVPGVCKHPENSIPLHWCQLIIQSDKKSENYNIFPFYFFITLYGFSKDKIQY